MKCRSASRQSIPGQYEFYPGPSRFSDACNPRVGFDDAICQIAPRRTKH